MTEEMGMIQTVAKLYGTGYECTILTADIDYSQFYFDLCNIENVAIFTSLPALA